MTIDLRLQPWFLYVEAFGRQSSDVEKRTGHLHQCWQKTCPITVTEQRRSVTMGIWPTKSKLIALRYEARRELTFFEGTLVIQICYRIVVLSLCNTSARKKKSPDPLPPNSRISNPFVFPCSNSSARANFTLLDLWQRWGCLGLIFCSKSIN